MWLLYLLSWVGFFIGVAFATVAIAAGLFYLAEMVEEYTTLCGKVIRTVIVFEMILSVALMLFESEMGFAMPFALLITHFMHLALFQSYPLLSGWSPPFIMAAILFFANHYMALQYFGQTYHQSGEVISYYIVCLWLVPFCFFVSFSAYDNVLPTVSPARGSNLDSGDVVSSYFQKSGRKYNLLNVFKTAKDRLLPVTQKKGF